MKTIIGLLWSHEDAQNSIHKLKEAGFAEDRISVLTRSKAVWKFLGDNRSHVMAKYVGWGILFGIAIYGLVGLTESICGCTLFDYSLGVGIRALLSYIAIGTIFGAIMGSFVGIGELEKNTHLYTQGVNRGGALMVVQGSDDLTSRAMNTLRQVGAVGVKIYPELKKDRPRTTSYQ